ncbi:hypothetical protein ACFSCW_02365 [Sphingomonas tabacisoli]|uniref:Uncharacterized protein n=1 Tax=Sphingomonas tabacisoli TaxID=2249466 RepID=A0ABW4HZC0_9SPHN
MFWISFMLIAFIALAVACAMLLMRSEAIPARDEVEPMKKALERRIREGAEFRL